MVDILSGMVDSWLKHRKDVNVFYIRRREKNARKYDKRKEYGELSRCVTDTKLMFIDYTNILGR